MELVARFQMTLPVSAGIGTASCDRDAAHRTAGMANQNGRHADEREGREPSRQHRRHDRHGRRHGRGDVDQGRSPAPEHEHEIAPPSGPVGLLVREFIQQQQVERHQERRHAGGPGGGPDRATLDQRGADHGEQAQAEAREDLAGTGPREQVGVDQHRHGAERHHSAERPPADLRSEVNPDEQTDDGARDTDAHGATNRQGARGNRAAAAAERGPRGLKIDTGPHVAGFVEGVHRGVERDEADDGQHGGQRGCPVVVGRRGRTRRDQGDRQKEERRARDSGVGSELGHGANCIGAEGLGARG